MGEKEKHKHSKEQATAEGQNIEYDVSFVIFSPFALSNGAVYLLCVFIFYLSFPLHLSGCAL